MVKHYVEIALRNLRRYPGAAVLNIGASCARIEHAHIERILRETENNLSKAARILGIDRKTLYRMRESLAQNAPDVENWDIH